jgi:hypothetical protein
MNHLNQFHYSNSSLRDKRTVSSHFVRTEIAVRNERVSKQQLQLLQICIEHLEELVIRGEKLYLGIAEDKGKDRRQYQLPDGLIDCFEDTAFLLMQATSSVVAVRNEADTWKNTFGQAIDDLETPSLQTALEKTGKLAESGRASMTKAEKALILTVGEDIMGSMGSMGNAGPELLVSVLLQNIGKRSPLDGVEMDINQLYQEYTSKLVSKACPN